MESLIKHYQLDRSHIAYLRFTLEAYDGIAVMTTVDRLQGVVSVRIPPDFETVVDQVMIDLATEIGIQPLPALD